MREENLSIEEQLDKIVDDNYKFGYEFRELLRKDPRTVLGYMLV